MRKILFVLSLLVIAGFIYTNRSSNLLDGQKPTTPVPNKGLDLENGYRVQWELVGTETTVRLISNLKDERTSQEVIDKYSCEILTSAGFYGEDGEHIGLFVSDGETISRTSQNFLFNGLLILDNEPKITNLETSNHLNAVQTGPLLIKEGVSQNLSLKTDKNARRIVAAITNEGELLLAAFYNKDSVVKGPLLSELPRLLLSFADTQNIKIDSAINLDGGTASVFYKKGVNLPELVKVGGFLCVISGY